MTPIKRNQLKISSLWLVGILFCEVIFAGGCTKVFITTDEVHQRIQSGLPLGSTFSQVNDFLKKQKWDRDFQLSEFRNSRIPDNMLTEAEQRNINWYSSGRIQHTQKSLFSEWDMVIVFYYDKEEKLITYKFYSYCY